MRLRLRLRLRLRGWWCGIGLLVVGQACADLPVVLIALRRVADPAPIPAEPPRNPSEHVPTMAHGGLELLVRVASADGG